MTSYHTSRQGTILIITAGVSGLLASLALAFLVRMRGDAEETALTLRDAQARITLMAACMYLQEASRIGWETGAAHEETFGWIDARDGSTGPKIDVSEPSDGHRFPVGTARRFPLFVMERPPAAVQLTASYNPIRTPFSPDPVTESDAAFGRAYLTKPDPQPVVDNGWNGIPGSSVNAARFSGPNSYLSGDTRQRQHTAGVTWFRIYRDTAATFVITCGAGATHGYRDWASEIAPDPEARALFGDDPGFFATLRANETRLWYRVEWNAAAPSLDYHMMHFYSYGAAEHYMTWPPNASHSVAGGGGGYRTQMHAVNMGGTILWVQRLAQEPTRW